MSVVLRSWRVGALLLCLFEQSGVEDIFLVKCVLDWP